MSAEPLRKNVPHADSTLTPNARVGALRKAFRSKRNASARSELFEALVALAGESLARNDATATDALAEAEAIVPSPFPADSAWRERMVMLHRTGAALAQKQGRHPEAVKKFEAALAHLPSNHAKAGRDANAARLQLLVRLARSRLMLGQAVETAKEMAECEAIAASLQGQIPAQALDAVQAAILANAGAALLALKDLAAAEAKFEAGIALIDRLANPALSDLRRQILQAWTDALRAKGRGADAEDVLARVGEASHEQSAATCGCGHDHHHQHAHQHKHHHDHEHDHAHDHGSACGCGSHSH